MSRDPPHFPPPPRTSAGEPLDPGRPAIPPTGRRRSGLWLVVALLAAPWVAIQVPREIGRWHLALAIQAQAQGERVQAEQHLLAAMRWFPEHPALYVQQAQWRLDEGKREEALAAIAQVREAAGDATYWLMVQAYFLQTAGEFEQAVPLWRIVDQRSQTMGIPPRSEALNGLAYAMALADVELEEALRLAEEALTLNPDSPSILDTRGYILYRLQRYGEAARDLKRAAAEFDAWLVRLERLLKAEGLVEPVEPPVALPTAIVELFPSASGRPAVQLAQARRAGAVIHYHLALVFQAVGRQAGAELELQKARELAGREPDASLF